VAEIAFVPAPAASGRTPHIEHRAPFPPADVLGEWAKSHLVAAGSRGSARFVVREATIVAVPLRERTANWRDWFRRQPIERFDGAVEIALDIRDVSDRVVARIEARATQSVYLMDDWKPGDREKRLATLTEQMVGAALRRLAERTRAVAPAYVMQ
jgi:Lon protease-like protein